jgi:Fe-S-cluster-containing hydrogenase component 2
VTKLKFLQEYCYGCKMCEIACSFHHTGCFGLAHSSIHISMDHDKAAGDFNIDSSCDSCENERIPFCIEYCQYGALEAEREENAG